MRIVRHLGARACPADDIKALVVVPTFPGESVSNVHLECYHANGGDSAIDQPGEINWYGLSLPWQLVFTTAMLDQGGVPGAGGTVAAYDLLFQQYLKGGDDEYYGGDVDADPETVTGEEGHDTTGADGEELIDSGPIGVHKWFSREVLMQPFAAEGTQTIRFGDAFSADTGSVPVAAMGSLLIFGVLRHEHAAETNFNAELDDATSREAMGLLLAGDYTKVGAMVEGNTAALGDYLRTVLFGGDNYIEASTLKGDTGKSYVKARTTIHSALSRSH